MWNEYTSAFKANARNWRWWVALLVILPLLFPWAIAKALIAAVDFIAGKLNIWRWMNHGR